MTEQSENEEDFSMDQDFWNESYQDDPENTIVEDFFLEKEAENLIPGTALDVGCGTGPIALKLAAKGWTVTGVDWAEAAIKQAAEAARRAGLAAAFYVGDTTQWEPPDQYDLVYSTFALPEGAGQAKAIEVMRTALKPGGTLIICEWDKRMAAIWGFKEEDLPSPDGLVALLPGLEIETAETRHVQNAFADDPLRGGENSEAYIAFVRAVKPVS
jgi:2-polyprenyl-3-methyl-5-hydroxy-6-metoxy-1,4-benzoquinol methylase